MDAQSLVIDFAPSGKVEAMHSDKFPLAFLGQQSIKRASELIFNEETQKWGIHPANSCGGYYDPFPEAADFDTYDNARKCEVEWFNRCRLEGVDPSTAQGREILIKFREPIQLP